MVRATISINRKLARLKFINNKRKKNINLLKLRENQAEFQITLTNRFEVLEVEKANIDTRCEQVTKIIVEEAASIAPLEQVISQRTEEDRTIDNLNTRQSNKTAREKIEYTELVKTTRKKRRQGCRKRREDQIKEILATGRGPKEIDKLSRKKARIQQLRKMMDL